MGAGGSVEGFKDLPEEEQKALQAKYDAGIAEGKTEEDMITALKVRNTSRY